MAIVDFQYIGSFQKGVRVPAEHPIEQVWNRIGLWGSEEYLSENLTDVKDKKISADYIAVRVRQAVELCTATRDATLLTAPLSLYYSALNLTRACLAIRNDFLDSKKHGLSFRPDPDILQCHAKVTDGTFYDYLRASGLSPKKGIQISLDGCLSRIIEIAEDYFTVARKPPDVCPVKIDAYQTGKMFLHFIDCVENEDFRSHWQDQFPSLVNFCHLAPTGACLRINQDKEPNSIEDVASFCNKMLETNLILNDAPTWFILRRTNPDLEWPRAAYYFVALFILGSIVRYEPELIYQITSTHSKWNVAIA